MKVGADAMQNALARLDRCTSRTDENCALRFDRPIASPHDAIEQNDLQQRHTANHNPALQAGIMQFSLQASGVSQEFRGRNDVLSALLADRDINLKQRHTEVTLERAGFVCWVAKLSGYVAFQRADQPWIARHGLADEFGTGAVNDPPV